MTRGIHKSGILWLALLWGWCSGCGGGPSLAHLQQVLHDSWRSYGQRFISPEGRVVIPQQDGETISEAQAYALLRSVWADDPATFARVYAWTYQHLSRARTQGDSLLAWRWGQQPDGAGGVLDANTASDGDLDYALALILAGRRGWRAPPDLPPYLEEARRVMAAILEKEVVSLPTGEALLTPGNWHEAQPPYLVNPSYFFPGAYQIFFQVDGDPRWGQLRRDTYRFLDLLAAGLGGQGGVGLFPDWCRVDAQGGVDAAPGRSTDFGWEAVRLPWRLALDYLWFGEPQAAHLLARQFLPFFKKEWQAHGRLAAVYHDDGKAAVDYESPVIYAGVLAAAMAAGDGEFAGTLAQKILSCYQEKDGQAYFVDPDNYYANNWAWLGLALYAGQVRPSHQGAAFGR